MKDNFSARSNEYAKFRPVYPPALYDFLFELCRDFDAAWDCGTGNGQIAVHLAERFARVEATDISQNQLDHAQQHPSVRYSLQPAEAPDFPDRSFDLICVGQAAHWFDLERFYTQARRALKPGGLLALVGYNLLSTGAPEVDGLVQRLYWETLKGYWDAERKLVDEEYAGIPFPFDEIRLPSLNMEYRWDIQHLSGYLGTWSAVQHFIRKNGRSPLDDVFLNKLKSAWPAAEKLDVRFPLFGRIGRHA